VLIPLTGLDPALGPLICAVVGAVTIGYTSAGGLRAVVFTDVAQTAILFAGAVLTLGVITWSLGGVGAWWPDRWDPNWDPPRFWFGQSDRTVAGGLLAAFLWYICTCGSDQMAIQRYLSTRDVKSARSAFAISMGTDAIVTLFLGAIGLALLAYFRAHPALLPAGKTIGESADQLFPRFIASGLPAGLSGLIVAALLAAAMSSLSAGVNSSSSVITTDLLGRFWPRPRSEAEHIRLNRRVSVGLGVAVVALSLYISLVPGNLLEVAYRVSNLLVAPLFSLFFMAMFVPWATSFGTLVGAAASVIVAVGIGHFRMFGLDFLWIMPGSLAAGVVAGMLASLPAFGPRRTVVSPPSVP
jgi:solute:Na+ symporter, SSS family